MIFGELTLGNPKKIGFWMTSAWIIFYEGSRFPFLIVTFDNIPPTALKRFRFHPEPKMIYFDGVAHLVGRFRAA